jgi:hypothetical protein
MKRCSAVRAVLGPGRYKLWKEGRISFSDLIDQRGNPMTIEQLKAAHPTGAE